MYLFCSILSVLNRLFRLWKFAPSFLNLLQNLQVRHIFLICRFCEIKFNQKRYSTYRIIHFSHIVIWRPIYTSRNFNSMGRLLLCDFGPSHKFQLISRDVSFQISQQETNRQSFSNSSCNSFGRGCWVGLLNSKRIILVKTYSRRWIFNSIFTVWSQRWMND